MELAVDLDCSSNKAEELINNEKKSDVLQISAKSSSEMNKNKMSLHLPLDTKLSSGESSQSTPSRHQTIARDLPTESDPPCYADVEFEEFLNKKQVPLLIVLLIILSYVVIGAYLFHKMEGWGYGDAAYFCFITLTTIGFGDFVPKPEGKSDVSPEYSITICSIYILIGISLIVMSINLVQERIVISLRKVALNLGLIEEKL